MLCPPPPPPRHSPFHRIRKMCQNHIKLIKLGRNQFQLTNCQKIKKKKIKLKLKLFIVNKKMNFNWSSNNIETSSLIHNFFFSSNLWLLFIAVSKIFLIFFDPKSFSSFFSYLFVCLFVSFLFLCLLFLFLFLFFSI